MTFQILRHGMRPRFSLRTLFLATTAVAGLCYWLVLPTLYAQQFVRAVETADYELADDCFKNREDRTFVKWNVQYSAFKPHVQLLPFSWRQFWSGHRQIQLDIVVGNPGRLRGHGGVVTVTQLGIETPQLKDIFFGGMSLASQ